MSCITPTRPNNADPPNAAMTPHFHSEHHWRGVGDLRRWGKIQLYDISGVH